MNSECVKEIWFAILRTVVMSYECCISSVHSMSYRLGAVALLK